MGPKFKSPAPKNYFDMLMHVCYPTAGWGSEKVEHAGTTA